MLNDAFRVADVPLSRRSLLSTLLTTVAGGILPELVAGQEKSGTVHHDIVASLNQAPLRMKFGGSTVEDFVKWQTMFRAKLNELLGDSSPPQKWKTQQESKTEFSDHVRYELLLQADGIPSVPLYLLVPKGLLKGQKAPAVVCLHGHGDFGHDLTIGRSDIAGIDKVIKQYHADYGLQFVRRGFVVAAPCMIPFGRRVDESKYAMKYGGKSPCAIAFIRMQALGQLLITANLRDIRWTIDLLQQRPEVIPDRIGCAGHSYGGRMTMLATAIDDRIRVTAVSGALNLLQERLSARFSCGAQIIPHLLEYGDFSEIGSLIAPRPCVWEVGSKDSLIVPQWDDIFRNRLRRAYRACGVTDQLLFDKFEGAHVWNGRKAFPLFEKKLKK